MLTTHTARLTASQLGSARALMDLAFDDFTDGDWAHALGGQHALVERDGVVVAHASLVRRHLMAGGRVLRAGYVEAVAVHPDDQRQGLGGRVMAALEELAPAYELLALGATSEGRGLYERRGWTPWRGRLSVLSPTGVVRTPDDEGHVLVLVEPVETDRIDLDGELTCDWRAGDVW